MARNTEPAYLAGPPLFWRLLAANLLVVLGGAVVGTTLTRQFVMRGSFTPLTHALMVLAAIALSAALTAIILHVAFQPLRSLRRAIERAERPPEPARHSVLAGHRFGDPDILAVANAVQQLWERLDQHVRLLEDSNHRLEAQRAELAEKTVQLEHLATQVLAAQEEERRRIARELHDDTMQSMAALIMGLERGLEAMPEELPHLRAAHQATARLRDLAVRMLDDLRHLALDLRPAVLDDHGLVPALHWLAQAHAERSGLDVQIAAERATDDASSAERLPAHVETVLYRIAQEALANVEKHARATHATVRLIHAPDRVLIEILDDGVGLPAGALPPERMGLFNMRERAALLGGSLAIDSGSNGRGTRVSVSVPLPDSSRSGGMLRGAGSGPVYQQPSEAAPDRVPAPLVPVAG